MLLPAAPSWVPSPSLCPPDMLVMAQGEVRSAHRVILARLSSVLQRMLKVCQDEEECCVILPDVSPATLDIALNMAYSGMVGGVSRHAVREVRDLCKLLSIRQEDFVVRAEHIARRDLKADVEVENELTETGESDLSAGGFPSGLELCEKVDISHVARTQGCFQCPHCMKTFIYIKSFERHTSQCQKSDLKVEEPLRKGTRARRKKVDIDVEDSKGGEDGKDRFQFVHFEHQNSEVYCRFPGCVYHQSNRGFKTLGGCKNHQLLQHASESQKVFKCKFCDKAFASNQLRNKHENLAHIKRFPCSACGKVFSEKTRLLIHNRTHSGEKPYVCEDCGFSCAQKDNLRLHKQFKHPSTEGHEKRFSCPLCPASFLTKSNLSRHSISHSDLKQCVCETCGKGFKDPAALKQHTFSHSGTEFPCDQCNQRFTSPLYLSRHMSRKHPSDGVLPLTCNICGRGFPLNHQLQQHIDAVHRQVKHCCPHCNLPIGRRSSVHRHIKKGRCRGHPTVRTQQQGYDVDVQGAVGKEEFQMQKVENKEESLHERFSQLQSGEVDGGGISAHYHSATTSVMLGQFSEDKQAGEVVENFHETKTGGGGGEILGVFHEKQTGELLGQRLPSLVLPLPPLSSIT